MVAIVLQIAARWVFSTRRICGRLGTLLLDMARFPDPGFEKPLVDILEQRFARSPLDLVVPVGVPAVLFAAQHRNGLFVAEEKRS